MKPRILVLSLLLVSTISNAQEHTGENVSASSNKIQAIVNTIDAELEKERKLIQANAQSYSLHQKEIAYSLALSRQWLRIQPQSESKKKEIADLIMDVINKTKQQPVKFGDSEITFEEGQSVLQELLTKRCKKPSNSLDEAQCASWQARLHVLQAVANGSLVYNDLEKERMAQYELDLQIIRPPLSEAESKHEEEQAKRSIENVVTFSVDCEYKKNYEYTKE